MIWFSSDHHFGHKNVIEYCSRPFKDVEEMGEVLVERWNEKIQPEDVIYYLGDFSLSRLAVERYLHRLNGIKKLVMGNHDHCHIVHAKKIAKSERMEQWYKEMGFSDVNYQMVLQHENVSFQMHHMPFVDDHYGEPRYKEHRPGKIADFLLHGHVHNAWKKKDDQINVGVDVWDFYPVNIDQIKEILK